MGQLTVAVKLLSNVGNILGVTDEVGKEVMQAALKLGKFVTPGSGSAGVEQNALKDLMNKQRQEQPMIQQLRASDGQLGRQGPGAPPEAGPMPIAPAA